MRLKYFDIIKGFSLDSLHFILLGVFKKVKKVLFEYRTTIREKKLFHTLERLVIFRNLMMCDF